MSARNSGRTLIFSFDIDAFSKNSSHRGRERVTAVMASAHQEFANSVVVINALIPAASTPHASTQATNQVESTATVRSLVDTGYVKF